MQGRLLQLLVQAAGDRAVCQISWHIGRLEWQWLSMVGLLTATRAFVAACKPPQLCVLFLITAAPSSHS